MARSVLNMSPDAAQRTQHSPLCARWWLAIACGLVHAGLMLGAWAEPRWLDWLAVPAVAALMWLAMAWPAGGSRRGWALLGLTVLGVLPLWLVQLWWTWGVTAFGTPPFLAIQACWSGLFVWALWWTRSILGARTLLVAGPVLWTGVEFVRGELFMGGYAWGLLAHPFIESTSARAMASVVGVYGLGFVVATMGALLAVVMTYPRSRPGRASFAWVLVVLLGGGLLGPVAAEWWRGAQVGTPGTPLAVAIVQTNVPQSNKLAWTIDDEVRDYLRFQQLTEAAVYPRPDAPAPELIVWPETMLPGPTLEAAALATLRDQGLFFELRQPLDAPGGGAPVTRVMATEFADAVLALSRGVGVPMLVGEEAWEGLSLTRQDSGGFDFSYQRRFNSVYLLQEGRVDPARYDKMELTPFGEYMPVISRVPALERALADFAAGGMRMDLGRGKERTVFAISRPRGSPVRAVTPICFEVCVPSHMRRLAYEGLFASTRRRADLFVNVTNDGWFGTSVLARRQHLAIARWRCAELGVPMVRAANTGISAIVGPGGELVTATLRTGSDGTQETRVDGLARAGIGKDGLVLGAVPIPAPEFKTIYAFTGDWAGWGGVVGGGVILAWAGVRRRGLGALGKGGQGQPEAPSHRTG